MNTITIRIRAERDVEAAGIRAQLVVCRHDVNSRYVTNLTARLTVKQIVSNGNYVIITRITRSFTFFDRRSIAVRGLDHIHKWLQCVALLHANLVGRIGVKVRFRTILHTLFGFRIQERVHAIGGITLGRADNIVSIIVLEL